MEIPFWQGIPILIAAYLLGSLSPGVWIAKKFGSVDLHKVGSGNTGATNVLRNLGWLPGVVTFVADFLKGLVIPILCVQLIGRGMGYWASVAAILGHAFPVFMGFKGGKCVATGLGVLLALHPWGAVCTGAYMLSMAFGTRIISLTSITGFALYALALLIFPGLNPDGVMRWFALGLAIFVIWRHRENVVRLVKGQEKRLHVPKGKKEE